MAAMAAWHSVWTLKCMWPARKGGGACGQLGGGRVTARGTAVGRGRIGRNRWGRRCRAHRSCNVDNSHRVTGTSSRRSRRSGCTEPGNPPRSTRGSCSHTSGRTSLGTCSRRDPRLGKLAPAATGARRAARAARAARAPRAPRAPKRHACSRWRKNRLARSARSRPWSRWQAPSCQSSLGAPVRWRRGRRRRGGLRPPGTLSGP